MYMHTNFMNMNIYSVDVHSYVSYICILQKCVYMYTHTCICDCAHICRHIKASMYQLRVWPYCICICRMQSKGKIRWEKGFLKIKELPGRRGSLAGPLRKWKVRQETEGERTSTAEQKASAARVRSLNLGVTKLGIIKNQAK